MRISELGLRRWAADFRSEISDVGHKKLTWKMFGQSD